jgi:hypothetical protein
MDLLRPCMVGDTETLLLGLLDSERVGVGVTSDEALVVTERDMVSEPRDRVTDGVDSSDGEGESVMELDVVELLVALRVGDGFV